MTSRERVIAAIEHREPDRVPVDLGATPSSGISAIAYGRLKRQLGFAERGHTRVYDVVQQLAQPEEFILDQFSIDTLDIGRSFNTTDDAWYNVTLADGSSAQYPRWFHPEQQSDSSWIARSPSGLEIARMPAGGTFFDQSFTPYLDDYPTDFTHLDHAMSQVLWAALVHSPWDHAGEADFWATLRSKALSLRQSSDRALMIVIGCNLFEWGTFLRRVDGFLCDLLSEPDKVEALLDALMERHLATLDRVCRYVGDVADIVRFGDDLGMTHGPFMSPELYRRFFKPRHATLCSYVKKHSRMKTFLHSCGSIRALLPDLIEAGFDVINPVQTNCHGMEPSALKRDFGRDICFWGGGCDTQHVLNKGSPEEVRRQVLERLEIFSPGGGFVFNTIHNILPDVPPENIVAMYNAVAEFAGAGNGKR
jgi:uroporphyrinogen decarboxylase